MGHMLFAGLIIGAAATAVAVVFLMRRIMLEVLESPHSFDETVRRLEQAVKDRGWVLSESKDFNTSLAKHGVEFKPRVHLIALCKPEYAKEVLQDERRVACLMPCTFAVYEDDAGRVRVSKMNTGVMGKVFGGTVARVMGGGVAKEEKAMLAAALGGERDGSSAVLE